MRKSIVILFMFLAAAVPVLPACSGISTSMPDITSVTFACYGFDPASHEVVVITSDYTVRQYDFTLYWMGHSFDYFSNPLPPAGEYTMREWRITEDKWHGLMEALTKNNVLRLPTEMEPIHGDDFPSCYIEIAANGSVHRTGGYGAGYGNGAAHRRFRNMADAIRELIRPETFVPPAGDTIVSFLFYYPSETMPDNYYEISKDGNAFRLTGNDAVHGVINMALDEEALSDLQDIVAAHRIAQWNGFDETAPENRVTSANNRFVLFIAYDDFSTIFAQGDHVFPEGYRDAEREFLMFFNRLLG